MFFKLHGLIEFWCTQTTHHALLFKATSINFTNCLHFVYWVSKRFLYVCIVAIPDYTLLRRDRTRRRGEGVAVYARTSLKAEIWQHSGDNNVFELQWITTGDLFVGVVYHPPKPC